MSAEHWSVLIGLRLSIIRRAADMLVLHFGDIRPHFSGEGTVGAYALHVQCAWRLDGPRGTITGRDDLWEYAGAGEPPSDWSYEDGFSLQDRKFADLFVRDETTRSWVNDSAAFVVTAADQSRHGDVRLELANGYAILLFPAGCGGEAWRFFAPASEERHIVFPPPASDHAISRRKNDVDDSEWETWLKVIESPTSANPMQAPPPLILSAKGARYRCGRCGTVLAIAEFGALKGFVIHCRRCDRYNEASL